MTQPFIHALADVHSTAIGAGTRIWQFVVVLAGARIGQDCNICSHCLIENDVVIGDRVTVKRGVQLWDGLRVGDDVFIGSNVTFTNDKYPKSRNIDFKPIATRIEQGASIGGGAYVAARRADWLRCYCGCGRSGNQGRTPWRHGCGQSSQSNQACSFEGLRMKFNIDTCQMVSLPKISDPRGNLTFVEGGNQIPFDIQRVYYLYDVPGGAERGGHAHKGLHQLIIAMSGSFDVVLDDGKNKKRVHLSRSYKGLYVCPMIWRAGQLFVRLCLLGAGL